MSDVTVRETVITVRASGQPPVRVVVAAMGTGIRRLREAGDIDLSAVADGAVLVYRESNQKFEATNTPRGLVIDGGSF